MFINVYCFENRLVFPIYISDQRFEGSMDSLLVTDKNKSHLMHMKNFDRFRFHEIKKKQKIHFPELFMVL